MTDPARITVNGIEFAYLEAGPADGPLALCLHGFPDHAPTWAPLMADLAGAGYHAVAPWMRGYSPTGLAPDGNYQVASLALDAHRHRRRARGRRRARCSSATTGARSRRTPRSATGPTGSAGWSRSRCPTPARSARCSSRRCSCGGRSTCSCSRPRSPRWSCRTTTSRSSTTSGATGRPATRRTPRSCVRSRTRSASPGSHRGGDRLLPRHARHDAARPRARRRCPRPGNGPMPVPTLYLHGAGRRLHGGRARRPRRARRAAPARLGRADRARRAATSSTWSSRPT